MKSIGGEIEMKILQRDLDSVTEWSLRNKMKLHVDKFEFLLHGVSRNPLMYHLPFIADILSFSMITETYNGQNYISGKLRLASVKQCE